MNMCNCTLPERLVSLQLNASNYTQLKKNRILYHQYKEKHPGITVCNKPHNVRNTERVRYPSYSMKQSLEHGCWYNEYYCDCNCPNLTCKNNIKKCKTCDFTYNIPIPIPNIPC